MPSPKRRLRVSATPSVYLRGQVYRVRWPEVDVEKYAVVVSRDSVNRSMKPVVALITSTDRVRTLPTVVPLAAGEAGMTRPSWILCHELWTAPTEYLGAGPVGVLTASRLIEVEQRLAYVCDVDDRRRLRERSRGRGTS